MSFEKFSFCVFIWLAFADNFSVLSFLEALDDSVSKASGSEDIGSRQDESDLRSQSCSSKDPMDEGQ